MKTDESKNIFLSSCVETTAHSLNIDTKEAYTRLKNAGLIEGYISEYYDVLHTQSRHDVTEMVMEALKNRERGKGLSK